MNRPPAFTLRQTLEAMPLIFNPSACPDLQATIQFNITGSEPGVYHLQIAQNECVFKTGADSQPTLSINAPSDVWLGIVRGQISGAEALMKRLYSAEGDLGLLQKWGVLFQRRGDMSFRAPSGQRPAGPIRWGGGLWMMAAFVPWIIFWITFGSFGLSPLASTGLPFLLSAGIVIYRWRYNRPDWLELGGLAYFAIGGLMTLLGVTAFKTWGTVWSNLFLGAVWLASLLAGTEPLSMQYIKWNFDRRLWRFSLFSYINAAISLVWGWQALLAALLGTIGIAYPALHGPMTVLRYASLIPAYAFTGWYPKAGMQKPVKDTEGAMRGLRSVGVASIVVIAGLLAFSVLFQK